MRQETRLQTTNARAWWTPGKLPVAVLLAALLFLPFGANATVDNSITPNRVQSGSLLLRMKEGYVVATRMNTDVGINVSGLVARVSVKQSFRNDGSEWVEGIYVFPLPGDAAVDHMRMWVGERFIEGEIREKEQAKKEYEAAKASGRKASLVEQNRANLFTTSVANIAPGEEVTIEIEYLETVKYDSGSFRMRIPTTLTPRFIPGEVATGRQGSGWSADTNRVPDASLITPPMVSSSSEHRLTMRAIINAGVGLQEVVSRYHPIDVTDNGGSYEIRLTDDSQLDHDLELCWTPMPDPAARASLFSETVAGEPYYLLMVLPPDNHAAPVEVVPRDMIFIIDTSGSMHGVSMQQAKNALMHALNGLRPSDRFNVIQFNSGTSYLFPASVDATPRNIGQAKDYVRALAANGGTNMYPALDMALRAAAYPTHLRQIVFITDGSVGNETELFTLIEQQLGDARLFTVGIGSAPNGWFMRKSAEAGRGTFTFISAMHEVDDKMSRLFRKLETPRVTEIEVLWPQGVVVDAYPAKVADLYAGEPVLVRAKLSGQPRSGDVVSISGNSVMGSWNQTMSLSTNKANYGVGALWARARIAELMDGMRRGEDAAAVRAAVVDTALDHHLVSKYTSLVAVDKTPVRPMMASLNREQVPNLMPHGQSMNAVLGFPATATSAPAQRIAGILSLLLAFALLLMSRFHSIRSAGGESPASRSTSCAG